MNHWDKSLEDGAGDGPFQLNNSLYPYCWSHIGFRAYWEGGDREPGEELVQAQSYMAQQAKFIDKVNVGRQLFLCYRILPQDVGPHPTNTHTEEDDLMYSGLDMVNPEQPEDLRMVDTTVAALSGGPYGEEDVSRLLPGWHNIRHTFHHARGADFVRTSVTVQEPQIDAFGVVVGKEEVEYFSHGLDLDGNAGIRATNEPLIFGDTELVVVADYGPRPSAWSETISDKGLGDREEADSTGSSIGKFEPYG